MTTVKDLLKRSLVNIGALGMGENISGPDTTDLFNRLNAMLEMWSTQSAVIFGDTEITHTLSGGVTDYTIGSGQDIDTARPLKIKYGFTRDGSADYPIRKIIDEYEYSRITLKGLSSSYPTHLYYKTGYPAGTIKLYPAPSAAFVLHLGVEAPLTSFASVNSDISLPPGYEEAIEYNLMKRIAGSYGKQLTPEQLDIAADGFANIKRANRNNDFFESDIDFPSKDGNFNIFSGNYD